MKKARTEEKQEQTSNEQTVKKVFSVSVPHDDTYRSVPERPDRHLLIETALVLSIVVPAIRYIDTGLVSEVSWLLGPLILVIAAFLPTRIRHRRFADFGFNLKQIKATIVILGETCIAVFPLAFCGLWVLKSYGIGLPLPSGFAGEHSWFGWLFYQFMYVSVSEEVFFRGYLQSNILKLVQPIKGIRLISREWISIILSAVCFAFAHVVVQGRPTAALTFLPGLIFGWLFIRTGSLLAPILFHGLANICYILMVGLFE